MNFFSSTCTETKIYEVNRVLNSYIVVQAPCINLCKSDDVESGRSLVPFIVHFCVQPIRAFIQINMVYY